MRGQLRMRQTAMAWVARLRARSPPRLSRWRTVRPLLAGIGLVPPRAANAGFAAAAAGVGEAHDGLRGVDRPDAKPAGEPGGDVADDGQQLGVVVFQQVPGLAERERQASDLCLPDGLFAAGASRRLPPG